MASGAPPSPPPARVWLELTPGPEDEVPRAEVAVLIKQGAKVQRHAVDELPGWPEACERRAPRAGQAFLLASTSMAGDLWEVEARLAADGSRLLLVERSFSEARGQHLVEELAEVPLPAGAQARLVPCPPAVHEDRAGVTTPAPPHR